jgi:hypothetical protein
MAINNTPNHFTGAVLKYLFIVFAMFSVHKSSAQCTATITTNGSSSVCFDQLLTLNASPTGMYDYQWFINGQLGPLGNESYNIIGWNPGIYTLQVQITDNNNCTVMSAPFTITINSYPYMSPTSSGSICNGATFEMAANVYYGTGIGWTGPNNFTATTDTVVIPNFQASDMGSYTFTAESNGCISTIQVYADTIVYSPPTLSADGGSSLGPNSVCENDIFWMTATLGGSVINGGITWIGPNNFNSNSSSTAIYGTVANIGLYTVTYTGNTCISSFTLSDTVSLQDVLPVPVVTATSNGPVCEDSTLILSATVTNGTFVWNGPGGFTSTQLDDTIYNVQANLNAGWYNITAMNGSCAAGADVNGWIYTTTPAATFIGGGVLCIGEYAVMGPISIENINNPVYSLAGPNTNVNYTQWNGIISELADSGTYFMTVSGIGNCNIGPVSVSGSVVIDAEYCVWPGDVNNDLIADNMDVLDLGLGYGTQGPQRPGANYGWTPQMMTDWGAMQFCGQDMKFADCNGNGIITASDTFGLSLNYNQTHLKGVHLPQAKSTTNTDLYFDMNGITLTPGATVSIPIKLGTTSIPMVNVYGVAAQVKVAGISPAGGLTVIAPAGWMGSLADAMNFTKWISDNQTDWAYVRTDQNNASGNGTISTLQFEVPLGTQYQQVQMYFDNVRIIGNNGIDITTVNIIDDTATIYPTEIGRTLNFINDAVILPNPSDANAVLQLSTVQSGNAQVSITDITGRSIWTTVANTVNGIQQLQLPSDVAPGMYSVQVKDETGAIAKTLKWIRR